MSVSVVLQQEQLSSTLPPVSAAGEWSKVSGGL